ncbi:MAG: inorganic phosphate transporter [Pirellulales bacterium]|nr:inorganic phosphate transporter [Pirellulales bacterium]
MNRGYIWPGIALAFVVFGVGYTLYQLGHLALICSPFVLLIVILALAFDFTNGIHDAANSIATIVSTRVLTPLQAVIWAAAFNFVAAWIGSTHVAQTVGKGIVDKNIVDTNVVLSALLGAIIWNLITWYLGLPTSSSHALIGGLAGSAITKAGFGAVIVSGVTKVAVFIVLSPMIGVFLGYLIGIVMTAWFHRVRPAKVDGLFRKGQLLSAALYSLGHGMNDAQKTMGIIALLLFSNKLLTAEQFNDLPFWIILICHTAMGLGTLIGGWRIVKTMGTKIVRLNPFGGFCAETGAAATLFGATWAGIPVSTTHTITGSIIGYGAMRRLSAVRWGVAGNIVVAWILTIPVAGCIGGAVYWVVSKF